MAQALADTKNLLHPRQVNDLTETRKKLEGVMSAPAYVRNQLADGGALMQKQIQDIDRVLQQAPQPIPANQIDAAVKLEEELRTDWLQGMPTQKEMSRNPTGAVDKNMAWDRRSKQAVLRWKHLKRRLHASGISEHRLAGEGDVSNIERHRPAGGSGELNMDNEQIARPSWSLPPPGAGPAAVMAPAEAALLAEVDPDLRAQMPMLDNETRQKVLEIIRDSMPAPANDNTPPKYVDTLTGGDVNAEYEKVVEDLPVKPQTEIGALRAEAKPLGINTYGMGKDEIRAEIVKVKGA